ncbi:MAG: hypothetical protein ACOYLQ_16660 [Hyphomicrobiaceae bacterium]
MERAGKTGRDRYKKLDHDVAAIEGLFVGIFLDACEQGPFAQAPLEPPSASKIEVSVEAGHRTRLYLVIEIVARIRAAARYTKPRAVPVTTTTET